MLKLRCNNKQRMFVSNSHWLNIAKFISLLVQGNRSSAHCSHSVTQAMKVFSLLCFQCMQDFISTAMPESKEMLKETEQNKKQKKILGYSKGTHKSSQWLKVEQFEQKQKKNFKYFPTFWIVAEINPLESWITSPYFPSAKIATIISIIMFRFPFFCLVFTFWERQEGLEMPVW